MNVLNIGQRFRPKDPKVDKRVPGNSASRRMLRALCMKSKSRLERALERARSDAREVRRLADNCHEARRYAAAARRERRARRA